MRWSTSPTYVTFDRGRPLHVFDAKKVQGNAGRAPRAHGERLLALDGKTYAFTRQRDVRDRRRQRRRIHRRHHGRRAFRLRRDHHRRADRIGAVGSDQHRATGRKLGIVTDARYRFERGVDPAFTLPGSELATKLVMDLCGGEPSRQSSLAGASPTPAHHQLPALRDEAADRPRGLDDREQIAHPGSLGFTSPATGRCREGRVDPPPGAPTSKARPTSSRKIVRIAGVDGSRSADRGVQGAEAGADA
jgi:phenylalanyl-tRNA synthetase beta chain